METKTLNVGDFSGIEVETAIKVYIKPVSYTHLDVYKRQVTARITERSRPTRQAYLQQVDAAAQRDPGAQRLGCANVAHAFAAMPEADKNRATALDKIKVVAPRAPNIGIVNAYNDMLSAPQPLAHYPDIIKDEARRFGATAQVAGGVPAMCDGVTQGTPGMELSLFSRDTIAMATACLLYTSRCV